MHLLRAKKTAPDIREKRQPISVKSNVLENSCFGKRAGTLKKILEVYVGQQEKKKLLVLSEKKSPCDLVAVSTRCKKASGLSVNKRKKVRTIWGERAFNEQNRDW